MIKTGHNDALKEIALNVFVNLSFIEENQISLMKTENFMDTLLFVIRNELKSDLMKEAALLIVLNLTTNDYNQIVISQTFSMDFLNILRDEKSSKKMKEIVLLALPCLVPSLEIECFYEMIKILNDKMSEKVLRESAMDIIKNVFLSDDEKQKRLFLTSEFMGLLFILLKDESSSDKIKDDSLVIFKTIPSLNGIENLPISLIIDELIIVFSNECLSPRMKEICLEALERFSIMHGYQSCFFDNQKFVNQIIWNRNEKKHALKILINLSMVYEYKIPLFRMDGFIESLLVQLKSNSESESIRFDILLLLNELSIVEENKSALFEMKDFSSILIEAMQDEGRARIQAFSIASSLSEHLIVRTRFVSNNILKHLLQRGLNDEFQVVRSMSALALSNLESCPGLECNS